MLQQSASASDRETYQIHLIGNSHIDPVWLWPWTDGFSEVKATFQAALDRIREYPDFIFTCAGACYYQWVEQNCPDLFSQIQEAVRNKRWVPVNGWHIQPDCNIPCGESFARHSLYSQRYYLEKFGKICDVGYNVDSFGHNIMLPQILQLSGMRLYTFHRPCDNEKENLNNAFYWQSPDGSRLPAFKIPFSYNSEEPARLAERLGQMMRMSAELKSDVMFFYGVGNHGGGPTIALLNEIERLRRQQEFSAICYSSPSAYLKAMETKQPDLQLITDDLQIHAIGCYSAMLEVKQLNRRSEERLMSSERFDTLAQIMLGGKGQNVRLKDAWEKVMFNQFHDILAGCSLKAAYDDAADFYGSALYTAGDVMNHALQRISWAIDTMGDDSWPRSKESDWKLWGNPLKGTPMIVFNPLPFAVTAPVEAVGDLHAVMKPPRTVDLQTEDGAPAAAAHEDHYDLQAVSDATGSLLPIQQVRSTINDGPRGKWNTLFLARLPALGYATFWLHKDNIPRPAETGNSVSCSDAYQHPPVSVLPDGSVMENAYVSLQISAAEGGLVSLYDKSAGRQLLKGPAAVGLVIDETHSDTWGHGLREYRDVIGRFSQGTMKVLENGPLRGVVRLTTRWGQSTLEQDIHLLCDRPEIEISVRIFWQERHRMLKVEFPLDLPDARSCQSIPYGFMERPMDGEEKVIQQWLDVGNEDYGVSILNDSTHGIDVKDSTVRLTILRGAAYADHYGERDEHLSYMEQGERYVRYVLFPHAGDWRTAGTVQRAMLLNTSIRQIYETYHKGPLGQSCSGLSISHNNIVMTVFKLAEDQDGYILRCYESCGQDTLAEISLPLLNRTWTARFGPCQIKTFHIPFVAADPVRTVNLLEMDGFA